MAAWFNGQFVEVTSPREYVTKFKL